MRTKTRTITVSVTRTEYARITRAARAARMSRSAWMVQGACDKLARLGEETLKQREPKEAA